MKKIIVLSIFFMMCTVANAEYLHLTWEQKNIEYVTEWIIYGGSTPDDMVEIARVQNTPQMAIDGPSATIYVPFANNGFMPMDGYKMDHCLGISAVNRTGDVSGMLPFRNQNGELCIPIELKQQRLYRPTDRIMELIP